MSTNNDNESSAPGKEASPENSNEKYSQSQNNSGTLGRETEEEIESSSAEPITNEIGFAENEENHSSRNYAHDSVSNEEVDSVSKASEHHPKRGKNHINNPGGTSQEDVDHNKLPNDEHLGNGD